MPGRIRVRIASDGTCAFNSLSAWEAARARDITSGTGDDTIENVICSTNGGAADTTPFDITTSWTLSATNYITISVDSSYRHAGYYDTSKFRITEGATFNGIIDIRANPAYVRIDGLQIYHSKESSGSNESAIYIPSTVTSGLIYVSDIIGIGGRRTIFNSSAATFDMWNSIIYGITGQTAGVYLNNASGSLTAYSCTSGNSGGTAGFHNAAGTMTLKNCYANSGGTDYFGTITLTTCASSDSTGSVGLQTIAYSTGNFTNVTSGSENLHLVSGSSLIGVGTDTSGDSAPFDFTTDIDGDSRGSSWDVGADQIASPGYVMKGRYLLTARSDGTTG
jgi:hypothetical protein